MLGFRSRILFCVCVCVCVASLPLDREVLTLPHSSSDHPLPQQGGGREPCYSLAGVVGVRAGLRT